MTQKTKKRKEEEPSIREIKIKVMGIGGGGGSIVSEISSDLKKIKFAAANTDSRALGNLSEKKKIQKFHFGEEITKGLGTGMDPEKGKRAAEEEKDRIKDLFKGQDIVIFITSLGGGTGSGAIPVFSKMAKEAGSLTFGIFTLPFKFEGDRKFSIAKKALSDSSPHLNAVSIMPNENIFNLVDRATPLKEALSKTNKSLAKNLEGLIETIYEAGLINIDFADIRAILEEKKGKGKLAYLSSTEVKSEEDGKEIVKKAVSDPLYSYGIEGSKGVLFNITGGEKMGLSDVSSISNQISELTEGKAKVIFGISQKRSFKNKLKISLLATGCQAEYFNEELKGEEKVERVVKEEKKSPPKPKKKKEKTQKLEIESINPKEEEKVRRNGLEIKRIAKEEEREIIEEEEKWETPTFLRKALKQNNEGDKKGGR